MWIVPLFVLQNDPRTINLRIFLQMDRENCEKSFAIIFNHGRWPGLMWYEMTTAVENEFCSLSDAANFLKTPGARVWLLVEKCFRNALGYPLLENFSVVTENE